MKMWNRKLRACCLCAGLVGASLAGGAELVLADGGKTAYKVVAPENATAMEAAAAADLKPWGDRIHERIHGNLPAAGRSPISADLITSSP